MSERSNSKQDDESNVGVFFYTLMHELQEHVGMGTVYSELFLQDIPASEEKQRDYQEKVSQQFQKIAQMIEDYHDGFQNLHE